jgi:hypothetical protein
MVVVSTSIDHFVAEPGIGRPFRTREGDLHVCVATGSGGGL